MRKRFRGYLSEMAVSDQHGGGLTLRQVLGEDLQRFDALISVGSFARNLGPAKSLEKRSRQIDLPLDKIPERTNLLRKIKPWLRSRSRIHKWEVDSAWNQLRRIIGKRPRMLVCPQWSLSVKLTARAVKEMNAEYITWVMDDHPLKMSGAAMSYTAEYEKEWSEHLRGAHKVFVISEAMGEFYRHRFGIKSEVLHGAAPIAECKNSRLQRKCNRRSGIRCAYAGSLSGWTRDGLELVAAALAQFGGELHVAASRMPDWLERSGVIFHEFMSQESVKSLIAQCDVVVLPISFTAEHAAMSRLNIATKLSELCASGRPILAIGPADAAMICGLQKRNAAICITKPSKNDVLMGIKKLADYRVRKSVVANAKQWFTNQLNLELMRTRWIKVSPWLLD
jgi:hypothetical protein